MNLMTCRKIHLELIFLGYQKTGIPLIEYFKNELIPFSAADDIGLYVVIPKFASLLSLSIDQTVNLFLYGLAFLGWSFSIIGFFLLYQKILQKIVAFIAISLLSIIALQIGDIYLFYVFPAIALVPWSLYFFKKPFTFNSLIFYFCSGFIIAFSHYIRAHSCLAVFSFIAWLLLTSAKKVNRKILAGIFLCIGLAVPNIYFNYTYKTYSEFIKKQQMIDPAQGISNHLIWHSIYAGLGLLSFKNPDNIRWGDPYPVQKAQSINPHVKYNTVEYEKILKNEIIELIKKHPIFIVLTIFAKIGILFLYLLMFANFGLLAALFFPKPWHIEIAFWSALVLSSLSSLLVLPIPEYSLGFIAFATLYGITSINNFIKNPN